MFTAILVLSLWVSAKPVGPLVYEQESGTISLCKALDRIQVADRMPLKMSGVYVSGYMFDPDDPDCEFQVERTTCVEFSPQAASSSEGRTLKSKPHRPVVVTFRGILHGPRPVGGLDSRGRVRSTSPRSIVDLLNRVSASSSFLYCDGLYRTKFVVDEVLAIEPYEGTLPDLSSGPSDPVLPSPISVGLLDYPPEALRIGYEGSVLIDVEVVDGRVASTVPTFGDPALVVDALKHLATWEFADDTQAKFTVEYDFKLERRRRGESRAPRIELLLPTFVGVTAPEYDH